MNCFKPQLLSIPIMCWAVAGVLTLATPPPVQAVPLPGFTGFTGDQYGIINYAVLSPFDSFAGVLAGAYVPRLGDPAFDASKYTYLYQVASLPTLTGSGLPIKWDSFEAETRASRQVSTTTIGTFASGNLRLDFLNGGTVVNATGNNLQGAGSLGNAARTVSGPERMDVRVNFCCGRGLPNWGFTQLSIGFTSPIVGYQSNIAPSYGLGQLNGFIVPLREGFFNERASGGPIPNAYASTTSAPEPNVALVIGSGVMGLLVWRRKRWFTKASV